MAKLKVAALAAEVVLIAASVVLLAGWAGSSVLVAVGAGAALMGALAVASLGALLWGRGGTNAAFMASVVGTILAKIVVVGGAVWYVWHSTQLPRIEFIAGLMGGWIVSFAVQTAVLRATLKRPAIGEGP